MKKIFLMCTAVILLFAAACGRENQETAEIVEEGKKGVVSHSGEPVPGGVFKVGLSGETSFDGVFSYLYYENPMDWKIMEDTMYGSLERGEDLEYKSSEVLSFEPNTENGTLKMEILSDKFKWSDGSKVTSKDFAYAYEIIGHPDYTGLRYDDAMKNIRGMEEYHAGEAQRISGVRTPDENTIIISYKEFSPDILWGEGVLTEPVPSKQMEGVSITELPNSEVVRVSPLSAGPFSISQIIPQEKIVFKANEHFWAGKPSLEGVEFEWMKPIETLAALDQGRFDYIEGLDPTLYSQVSKYTNYSILKKQDLTYTYLGFKLGKLTGEEEIEVQTDSNSKMANGNLRTAMAYAIDREKVAAEFFRDLRSPGNSLILPMYENLSPKNPPGFPYNPENGKQLLEDAGYKDIDADGYREDPEGNPLSISFALAEDGYLFEELAAYYIGAWKEIGLNVILTDGKPLEFQDLYNRLKDDDPAIDVYQATWGLTQNPNPSLYYGKNSEYNYPRFSTEELEENLNRISSRESFDFDKRNANYGEFHQIMTVETPVIPLYYRDQYSVINKRVDHFEDTYPDGETRNWRWNQIILNREEPVS